MSVQCSIRVIGTFCRAMPEVVFLTTVAADLREKRVSARTRVLRHGPWMGSREQRLAASTQPEVIPVPDRDRSLGHRECGREVRRDSEHLCDALRAVRVPDADHEA